MKGERGDGAAECGVVVLAASGDLLDQAVATEALEDAGELGGCLRGEEGSQGAVSETGDVKLAA